MTTRRTVDIAVDAYDAPMLAALAKRRDHQRALGHDDDEPLSFAGHMWEIRRQVAFGHVGFDEKSAAQIKRIRSSQERERPRLALDGDLILMGEVAEVLESESNEERIYELLDVAAVCVRIAGKMQRDLDAKGGE